MRNIIVTALALIGISIAVAAEASSGSAITVNDEAVVAEVPGIVDEPTFPGMPIPERVRVGVGAFLAPGAGFGDRELNLVRPQLRWRADLPWDSVGSIRVGGDFGANLYDLDGSGGLFRDCADCPDPERFYAASLGAQFGYRLNDKGYLLRRGERWAVLATAFVRARWEPGALSDAVTPGASLGVGYEFAGGSRVALGGRIEPALDGDGTSISPSVYLRWKLHPKLRLETRGLGARVEYRTGERVEFFLTAFHESDRFRLDDRKEIASGATFQDRQTMVGGGLVVDVLPVLRLALELGAIVDRRVSFDTRSQGRLDSRHGDPSPYVSLRAEARP